MSQEIESLPHARPVLSKAKAEVIVITDNNSHCSVHFFFVLETHTRHK